MIDLKISNETDTLQAVVVGIAESSGPVPTAEEAFDPKSREYILKGQYPAEKDMSAELEGLVAVLKKYHVDVYRPKLLRDVNQIFCRDISFVIDDFFIIPNVIEFRSEEFPGITYLIDQMKPEKVLHMPEGAQAEGGDVMVWNDHLFVGYSEDEDFEKYNTARTNRQGVEFLRESFPNKTVKAFQLVKSDTNARENALHLDCCFQPVGHNKAIIYKEGFKLESDYEFLVDFFGAENLIHISQEEMYRMNANVFSISPEVVISEKGFGRLNDELRKRALTVEEIAFSEIAKQEGLLRCVTLPLRRK